MDYVQLFQFLSNEKGFGTKTPSKTQLEIDEQDKQYFSQKQDAVWFTRPVKSGEYQGLSKPFSNNLMVFKLSKDDWSEIYRVPIRDLADNPSTLNVPINRSDFNYDVATMAGLLSYLQIKSYQMKTELKQRKSKTTLIK